MRRRLVAVTLLAAVVTALTAGTAQARTLSQGMCGSDVHKLQHRLSVKSYLPDGYTPGCFDYRTSQAVMALQGWVRLPRTGVVDSLTWQKLRDSKTPKPWTGIRPFKHFEVHKLRQIMIVVSRHGEVLRTIHVSTAAPGHVTPDGHFRIYAKYRMSWSTLFHVWLPWANYVVGGIAIHGFESVPGVPASHGCIRVPMPEARWVYKRAKLNTPVWIK